MTLYFQDQKVEGVLFDKDGTLLDFEQTFGPASHWVFEKLSNGDGKLFDQLSKAVAFDPQSKTFGESSVVIAGTNDEIMEVLLPLLPEANRAELAGEMDRLFGIAVLANLAPLEGVDDLLKKLERSKVRIGLATNDSEQNGKLQLEAMAIADHFDFIAGFDSGYGAKPGKGMVAGFADHIGCSPSKVLMVGDTTHDMEAAHAAGAMFAGVGRQQELLRAMAATGRMFQTIGDLSRQFSDRPMA